MKTRKFILATMMSLMLVIALFGSACAPTPAATPVPPPAATAVPAPTSAPAPTAVPPTTAPAAALDMKATLDKYFSNLPDGFTTIAPAALNDQMAAAKPFIVDIRQASEIASAGYVEGAVNIPIRTFLKNLDKLPAKDQPIVVMCGSGHRSALGMEALQLLGYSNVKSLAGGFGAWKAAKLPVATGAPTAPVAGKAPDVDKDLLAALDKYFTGLPDGFSTIAPAALNDMLAASKPVQIDVRETKEIADAGYIAGSTNIPVRTLIKSLDKLPQDKSAVVIAECGSGHRSAMTMMALNLLGYTNVKSLAGGFGAWKNANLPISKASD
ncbi:MAG: rhodanese-like domain-containing protein [Chloroflexi bacterium]|nr:rhodanese-like domain-containing protein [Chloroflexota bacterium]